MPIQPDRVIQVAGEILGALRRMSYPEIQDLKKTMLDYHGFSKVRFSAEFLARIPAMSGVGADEVQPELICVDTDLGTEIHYHASAFAYVICLGTTEKLPEPFAAKAYVDGNWKAVYRGSQFSIPPGVHHGFTVDAHGAGGILYFLSVQSPPIVHDSHDDYHKVTA